MTLYLDIGSFSARGIRRDEQSCLVVLPNAEQDMGHGVLLAVADGIAGRPVAETAARDALKALGDHYYAAPENWGLKHALQESIAVANRAALAGGDTKRAAAVSGLVLRRRRWAIVHAGHTRVWLMRQRQLKQLTHDYVTPRINRPPQVDRACGLAPELEVDFISGELTEGDVFVLTNAAVHEVLTGAALVGCLVAEVSVQQMAAMIVERAVKAGGDPNACACVARIERVPAESREDLEEDVAALPAIAPPQIGDLIDDFRIERLTLKSTRYRLYKSIDTHSGQVVALKFPNPRDADDPAFAEMFLREEWIGRRVTSAHLVRTLPLKKGRRTVLYSVMAYPSGENLARRLARKGTLPLRESTFIGDQLLEALTQLHEQGIIHNDVRPQNIVMDQKSGQLMLLGLGTSYVPHSESMETTSGPSSRRANFLAPELFDRPEPTIRADIYAAGVTLYRMLTGAYPYGKITSGVRAPRPDYVAARLQNADIPEGLDAVLRRACAFDPEDRYETALEFADALDSVTAPATITPSGSAVAPKRRQWNWEIAALAGLLAVLLAYLVLVLRR